MLCRLRYGRTTLQRWSILSKRLWGCDWRVLSYHITPNFRPCWARWAPPITAPPMSTRFPYGVCSVPGIRTRGRRRKIPIEIIPVLSFAPTEIFGNTRRSNKLHPKNGCLAQINYVYARFISIFDIGLSNKIRLTAEAGGTVSHMEVWMRHQLKLSSNVHQELLDIFMD